MSDVISEPTLWIILTATFIGIFSVFIILVFIYLVRCIYLYQKLEKK